MSNLQIRKFEGITILNMVYAVMRKPIIKVLIVLIPWAEIEYVSIYHCDSYSFNHVRGRTSFIYLTLYIARYMGWEIIDFFRHLNGVRIQISN